MRCPASTAIFAGIRNLWRDLRSLEMRHRPRPWTIDTLFMPAGTGVAIPAHDQWSLSELASTSPGAIA
jgi:hypothetical protein